jgi:hypothetical protein
MANVEKSLESMNLSIENACYCITFHYVVTEHDIRSHSSWMALISQELNEGQLLHQ